jgi:hypothetical protein
VQNIPGLARTDPTVPKQILEAKLKLIDQRRAEIESYLTSVNVNTESYHHQEIRAELTALNTQRAEIQDVLRPPPKPRRSPELQKLYQEQRQRDVEFLRHAIYSRTSVQAVRQKPCIASGSSQMKPQRRRVLEKLIITDISGVDNPCQDPALVAIMKRTPQSKFEIAKLRFTDACAKANPYHDRRGRFTTRRKAQVTIDPFKRLGVSDFEDTANEIAKRDNCSRTEALAKARKENPEGFDAFQTVEVIREEEVAKTGKHPFELAVDAIQQQDKCTRAVAMQRARKK